MAWSEVLIIGTLLLFASTSWTSPLSASSAKLHSTYLGINEQLRQGGAMPPRHGQQKALIAHVNLRLRGFGSSSSENTEGCVAEVVNSDGREAIRCSATHELTRKMEAVWQYADTLRRHRRILATTPSSSAIAHTTDVAFDSASNTVEMYADHEDGCFPSDLEAGHIFSRLHAHLLDTSALLRHEVCYAMGQTGLPQAGPILINVLQNSSEHPMVRHEAAEGLAALCEGLTDNTTDTILPLLLQTRGDSCPEVAETCQVAAERIRWQQLQRLQQSPTPRSTEQTAKYVSVDPAPPIDDITCVQQLQDNLLNRSLSLFERYRAMFKLRDIGDAAAVAALCRGLSDPASALFRHEAAFVLGQLGEADAQDALKHVLRNADENCMVRHEAAEALGAIGDDVCREILGEFARDRDPVVADSCLVALDMLQYWGHYKNPSPQENA